MPGPGSKMYVSMTCGIPGRAVRLALGESLSMIGKLLGHNRIETTARYAHLARDTEKASAAKIGGSIGADILPADSAEAASWPS